MSIRVGQLLRHQERYRTDLEYREKQKKRSKEYEEQKRDVDKRRTYEQKRTRTLSEFRDRHCRACDALLHYQTKGYYCRKCFKKSRRPKKNAIQTNKS